MLDGFLAKGFSSRCKSLVKLTKTRIDAARRKKNSMHGFLKKDIAALLANGHDVSAYGRVEGLLSELSLLRAYDFVEKHCDFILNHLHDMQKHSECPKECQETVSSLMFAAARISDFPELRELRWIFQDKYTGASLENYVNKELAQCLVALKQPATMETKVAVMVDIAAEFSLTWNSEAFLHKMSKPPPSHSDPRRKPTPERRRRPHGSENADTSAKQQSNHLPHALNRDGKPSGADDRTHVKEGWAPPHNNSGEDDGRIPDRKSPQRRRHLKPSRGGGGGRDGAEDEEERIIDNLLLHYSNKQALYSPAQVRSKILEGNSKKLPEGSMAAESDRNVPEDSIADSNAAESGGKNQSWDGRRGVLRVSKKIPGREDSESGLEVMPEIQKVRSNSAPREQTGNRYAKMVPGHNYFSSSERSHVHPKLPYFSSSERGHVHPKLPDYDDLAARFEAMKAK